MASPLTYLYDKLMEFNFIKIFGGGKTLVDVGLFIPDSVESILLAFSSGEQTKESINNDLSPWLKYAAATNCLIIAPCAVEGVLYHKGTEKLIPRLLEVFFTSLEQRPRKMAVAGIKSGALSAYKVARLSPELFTKLTLISGPLDLGEIKELPTKCLESIQGEQIKELWA